MADDLTRHLYANLVNQLYAVPPPRRRRSCWVMNQEWLNECRKIGDYPETPRIMLPTFAQEIMLGLPVFVTGDGGFPHLIAD
jgi:hypothetical protein